MKQTNYKRGISLIVLVITIIIMIILATAVILSLSSSGIVNKANLAKSKNDISIMKEKYNMMLAEKQLKGESWLDISDQEKDNILVDYKGKVDVVLGELMITGNISDEERNELKKEGIPDATNYNSNKKVNKPLLPEGNGITAIGWSGSTERTENSSTDSWYNYASSSTNNTNKNWANMKTADGSYWVWIPRYAYKITSGYRGEGITNETKEYYGTIDVKFLIGTSDIATDGTKCVRGNVAGSEYVVHPAFTFGDLELEGIWVAKYKARSTITPTEFNDTTPDIIVDNVKTMWQQITIGNMFTKCREMETKSIYGWANASSGINSDGTDTVNNKIDTHLMKNIEWGAVAYLTTSDYGLKHNRVQLDSGNYYSIYKNELTDPYYGYPSTSGTLYGVYQMAGVKSEFVAALNKNSVTGTIYGDSSVGNSLIIANDKYKDIYLTKNLSNRDETVIGRKNVYGDATAEVMIETDNGTYFSRSLWYRDAMFLPYSAGGDFIVRGGHSNGVSTSDGSSAGNSLSTYYVGIYATSYSIGGYRQYVGYNSFRPVLVVSSSI